jgi:hypothetical protein
MNTNTVELGRFELQETGKKFELLTNSNWESLYIKDTKFKEPRE